MSVDFQHFQSAHCESGVTSNLFINYNQPLSEALAFGIGGGAFFGYFPFVKVNKLPLTTFRTAPGAILKKTIKRLGATLAVKRFRNQAKAQDQLNELVDQGTPVVLQTSVYWLPYFPPALRFHFNAHNLIVFGREGNEYLISDPVFETPVRCTAKDLQRARFATGPLGPRGRMSYFTSEPKDTDKAKAVRLGIKEACFKMTKMPVPFMGSRGIHMMANKIEKWPEVLGEKSARQHLAQLIRMMEEIGTGGGAFRFIYAAFLMEAAEILNRPALKELSREMTDIGDHWRQFALMGAKRCKNREDKDFSYAKLANIAHQCADREHQFFNQLAKQIS